MQPSHEVAEVFEKYWDNIADLHLNTWQLRTLNAIRCCRTAALGGHIDACDGCGKMSISYNSCRNRHCPTCQGEKRESWIAAREKELLPVPYFHVVFTLPHELNQLAMHEAKAVYDALFEASWATLCHFSGGNKPGMIALLHTWGQNLSLHPHIHCIVPSGTVNKSGTMFRWKNVRPDGKFLYSVKAMSKVFKAKYLQILREKITDKFPQKLRNELFKKNWVVFANSPFGNAKSVVEYLGRYSHKVAISNHRILAVTNSTVCFGYKDYKDSSKTKQLTLSHREFIRRFAQHILPKRFVRIRHYGILSSTWKRGNLKILQETLWKTELPIKAVKGLKVRPCPCCKTGTLRTILSFDHRGPPEFYNHLWEKLQPAQN